MSDGIVPVQPISRIEPMNRVFGPAEMDPGLYQAIAVSLCALFQGRYSSEMTATLSSHLISLVEVIQPQTNSGRKKKYCKKVKRNSHKINALLTKTFNQTH